MKSPAFWQRDDLTARLLTPAGWVYGALGALRWWRARPEDVGIPVICVGNATVGGTGKTPIVLDLLTRLRRRGIDVHGLCRGHLGRLPGPVRVEPGRHGAHDVGDEALLLAEIAPTWAARNRLAGARAARAAGARAIVLDDGLQYPHLAKTASLLVIDGAAGFGNGRIVPAGPLREPRSRACDRADIAVVVGEDDAASAPLPARLRPPWRCSLTPAPGGGLDLRGRRVLAFAGIGRPAKFFETVVQLGAVLAGTRAFPDHHLFNAAECAALARDAERLHAALVTTRKDAVRLTETMGARVNVVDIVVTWEDPGRVETWLECLVGQV